MYSTNQSYPSRESADSATPEHSLSYIFKLTVPRIVFVLSLIFVNSNLQLANEPSLLWPNHTSVPDLVPNLLALSKRSSR